MERKFKIGLVTLLSIITLIGVSQIVSAADTITYEQYLIKSLKDDNIGRRASAAQLLGDKKVELAAKPLLKMLRTEKDFRVRIVAAVSLYRLNDTTMISDLRKINKHEKNKTVKHVLAGIIKELQDQEEAAL